MISPVLQYISPEEYLASERVAESKHEYFKGSVVALAGASLAHNRITANIIREVGIMLKGTPCEIFGSDMRVSVSSEQSFTYPDATIVCGNPELLDDTFDTVKNPAVIFEVVSPSTESNDRGRKFFFYMQIPSFSEYFLVSSTSLYIQAGRKQEDGSWKFEELMDLNSDLYINSIRKSLPLHQVYANVTF